MSNPNFVLSTQNPLNISVGNYASPTFADIDGDGDLDAFVGSYSGNTVFYRNVGTAKKPSFTKEVSNLGISDVGISATPAFVDIDKDGDLDVFVGNDTGNITFFRNDGSSQAPKFTQLSTNFGLGIVDTFASPTFADIDGDGDFDAFVGDYSGDVVFFRNNGTATAPSFTKMPTNLGITNLGSYTNPTFADIDGDGDLDVFVGNITGNTVFFRNTGTAKLPSFTKESSNFGITDVGNSASPTFADIDGDGDLDSFVGNSTGGITFFNNGTGSINTNNAPTLTTFTNPVTNGTANNAITVTMAQLVAQGNEADSDGTVTGFVVQAITSGTLKIGTSLSTAKAWVAGSNAIIDANHQAFWTPSSGSQGNIGAFKVVAQDNGGAKSATPVAVLVTVSPSGNTAPVLTSPDAINYTDTAFVDSFATVSSNLHAVDANSNSLIYGIQGGTNNVNGTVSLISSYGILTVNQTTGAYKFVPDNKAIEGLGAAATTSFNVTVSDGTSTVTKALQVKIVQNGVTETLGDDNLTGTSGNDNLNGLEGNDVIFAGLGNDNLFGGSGDDILFGGLGNDVLDGGVGFDKAAYKDAKKGVNVDLNVTTPQSTLGAGFDKLTNIEGLIGSRFNDVLKGDSGNNLLNGTFGNDILTGNAGKDKFAFTARLSNTDNLDRITDFSTTDDTLVLSIDRFTHLTDTGRLSTANFVSGVGAVAHDRNDFIVYDTSTGSVYYDADGNGAGHQVAFVTLTGIPSLTAADIFIA